MSCERWASRTVAPRSTAPGVGASSPASSRTSVVLPEPLTPTSATRSPGPEAPGHVAQHRAGRRRRRDTSTASSTLSPSRARGEAQQLGAVARLAARRRSARWPPRCGTSASTCAPAARGAATRAPCAAAAGGGPRARPPGGRARRARARRPRSRPRTGAPSPSATSHVAVQTASRNQRSWVTTSIDAAARREVAREPVDALDVEVVGRLVEQQQLGAVEQQPRERDPPPLAARQRRDRACRCPCGKRRSATPPSRPSSTSRNAASPAHSWSARPPTSSSRIVLRVVELVALAEQRELEVARARDRARVGLLDAGDQRAAASTCRRRCAPTTPIRSPAETPSVTSRSTERLP